MAKDKAASGQGQLAEQGTGDIDWDHVTGDDRYFKPETNKDHDIVAQNWKETEFRDNPGVKFEVIKVDGEEYTDPPKDWTVTSKRALRELRSIVMAATQAGKKFIHIKFRKSLARGKTEMDATFEAENLDSDIDKFLPEDQRSR